jgi:hypothetical protein
MNHQPRDYPFHSALIVPAAQRSAANALASAITGGEPSAESLTYNVPLSPDGSAPATHYGCCTAVNTAMLDRMRAVLMAGALPGVWFYRWDIVSSTLVATNAPSAAQIAGQFPWDWARSLEDMSLTVVVAPTNGEGGVPDADG